MSNILEYTSQNRIVDSFDHLSHVFSTGKSRDINFRKSQLKRLYALVNENEDGFFEALRKDMKKPKSEAFIGDIASILNECSYFIENLDDLAKDEGVKPHGLNNKADKAIIRRDPLGTVLIIGSWNYPVQVTLSPLAGAIAAGNCAIVKLSEIAPHTAALITELFPKYMDSSCYRIVNGSVAETTALLKFPFNHIFYTGNSTVAKIIMEAASKNLTPVTLELGGKSPAFILEDADIEVTANRIAYGKLLNAGQTCIGVDYVMIHKSRLDAFVKAFKNTIKNFYGPNPQESTDYARIISDNHFDRLASLLKSRTSGDIVIGGETDKEERYIAPTLITNVNFDDPYLMSNEIFGPILPVVTYKSLEEALALVNRKNPPLALYLFTKNKMLQDQVLKSTRSGGVCINDCLVHQAESSLPFGGVGASVMKEAYSSRNKD